MMRTIMTVLGLFGLLFFGGCAQQPKANTRSEPVVISADKGALLSVISLTPRAGQAASDVRQAYFDAAFPRARENGMRVLGALPVTAIGVGEFAPQVVSFYAWPDLAAEQRFSTHPDWPAVKATRPLGWEALRIHDVVLERDLELTFRPDKTYTMASAWIDPAHPDAYGTYLRNIETGVADIGGRFIYQMVNPSLSSLRGDSAPHRVTFVEWDTADGLQRFRESETLKTHGHLLNQGTQRFELLVLANHRLN
ncbi:MAG: hypothetical protein AAF290_01260 [Pseudomonadota bacterium]